MLAPLGYTARAETQAIDATYQSSPKAFAVGDGSKSAWTELIASMDFDTSLLLLTGAWASAFPYQGHFVVDLAVGGAGAESLIVADLFVGCQNPGGGPAGVLPLGLTIPAGSRIAARGARNASSAGYLMLGLTGLGQDWFGPTARSARIKGYGPSSSGIGVQVDCGGTANTKGSWAEVISSSEFDASWLGLCVVRTLDAADTLTARFFRVDVGIGAGGSEQVIRADIVLADHANYGSQDAMPEPGWNLMPCSLPAGSRVAVRAQSTTTDAADRLLHVGILLVG